MNSSSLFSSIICELKINLVVEKEHLKEMTQGTSNDPLWSIKEQKAFIGGIKRSLEIVRETKKLDSL
ncbi:MAG: hypothetical protein WC565_08995 [Parcubacteria group bacterium]|jgi:hypothetical protein